MRRSSGWAVFGFGCAMALIAPAGAEPTTQVRLHGDVQRPTTLTLPTLRAAPVVTETVSFQSGPLYAGGRRCSNRRMPNE